MMKKVYFILIVCVTISSCDVLEPELQTSLPTESAIVDTGSAQGVLSGIYSSLQDADYYGTEYVLNPDLLADNSVFEGFYDSQQELDNKVVPINNLWIGNCWVDIYEVINSTNFLISKLSEIDVDDSILGEALALRALAYFDLLRVFGEHYDDGSIYGLPLLTEPIPENDFNQIPDLDRNSVAETYRQIVSDINQAIPLLAGTGSTGTISQWGALSLRARVNLYHKNYQAAFDDANKVITEGGFSLVTDLKALYEATEATKESIFEIEFNDQDQSSFNTFLIRRDEYNADASLVSFFEDGDNRSNFVNVVRNRNKSGKYPNSDNANNAKVFRLAELYLIRSEAAVLKDNDPSAGIADLNIIRKRAGLSEIQSLSTVDAYIDALLYERRAELNFEGHRFFDLVRLDKAGEILNLEDFRRVLPIPKEELQISDALVQNPGYASE
ncbi:MAG: RagB/SusD family nutrient uptake outer membrane protein [Flavobacteriaceae bacterium]|nr:RagB/SusD family nutrient uptake outer membrane protein [Flavobacteriaceae bacterium]MCY4267378.1 RagB/SusD family nutrient uptake outer membrane protein [Flavobacteriaceae bacterium]MCY4299670.1 RagB/SusD family nutrient uptake outer membrane protein [Flavobacteriaceae bacterium]